MPIIEVRCVKCDDYLLEYERDDSGQFVAIAATRIKVIFKAVLDDPREFPKTMFGVCRCGGETMLDWLT
jgi:hypothetical protein